MFCCLILQLEEKERKDQEEAQRLRLQELQNKTPEVTITVVNTPGSTVANQKNNSVSVPSKSNKSSKKSESVNVTAAANSSKTAAASQGPQMVTIKRVMESNGAEPTVTITLKGATPDKDKVLFTLVNGQGDYRTLCLIILYKYQVHFLNVQLLYVPLLIY